MSGTQRHLRSVEVTNAQSEKIMGRGLGATLCCIAISLSLFNLGFIIPSLIYAYSGDRCVQTTMDGISFPLSLWLKVDAYSRVGLIGLVLFIALVSCCSLRLGGCLLYLFFIIVILYSLFSLAWTIVGAILFWGKLNPAGYCTGGIQIYMYIFLILSFVGICCTCVGQLTQRKQLNNRY